MKALRSIAWRAALVVGAFAAGWCAGRLGLPGWSAYHKTPLVPGNPRTRTCRGVVKRLVGVEDAAARLAVVVDSGPLRGHEVIATEYFPPMGPRRSLQEGDRCLVSLDAKGRGIVSTRERDPFLLGLMAALIALLAATGGRKGVATSCSVAWAMLLVVGLLLPAVRNGARAALLCVPVAIAVAIPTLLAIGGWNRKSLAAIVGSLCGTTGAWLASACLARAMMLTGLEVQFGAYHHLENVLWFAPPLHDVDFAGVLVGAMMLAGLGAVMDVSMAVASTVAEVSHAARGTGLWALFRSGLGAGRDIIGIMVFTLVMVFVGSNLVAFVSLAPTGWAREWMRLLNYEEAAGELARAAAAGLGMALCVPAAALAAAFLARREAGESSPQCSSRRTAYRAVWRSVLAAGVCVVAAGVADEWTLRKCYGAGSDQIAARVVAFSEPVLETMARSADPRDKTCFHSQIAVVQPCYGPRAGSLMATRMLLGPNPAHNIVLRRGAIVSVCLEEEGGRAEVSILKLPLRYRWGLVAMVLVAVVVIVAGGAVGLRALGAMMLACGLLVVVLIPMLARGAPPLAASALFCGLALLGVFAVSGAADRKALSALVGSAAGLATAGILLLASTRSLGFTGTESVPARFLAWVSSRAGVRYDYLGLVTASLLVATLGLAIDMAVTVAAGVAQVYAARPGATRAHAFAAGMNISRDVVGTMVLTLLFAFVGMRLAVFLLPAALGLSPAEVVNSEAGSLEILYAVIGSFALATTGPATALTASLLGAGRPRASHRRSGWRRALVLCSTIAAALWLVGGGVAWWKLRSGRPPGAPTIEAPRSADHVRDLVRRSVREGRVAEALVALWAADRRDPHVEVELAYLCMARRWLAHARTHIERALALGAGDSLAHYVAGVVYLWSGQRAEARGHLLRAIEMDPKNEAARQALETLEQP